MVKTASEFDARMKTKRQRPIGICGDCGNEKELRQREPEPLCGACLEKLRRAEAKENDPEAALRDARKPDKKVRSGMNRVLDIADAVDGFIPVEDVNALRAIARRNLMRVVAEPDGDGHGHDEIEHDHDQRPTAANESSEAAS
jgi:hypothetical protein